MSKPSPIPLSAEEHDKRLQRVEQIAARLRFRGRVEYQHAWSGTGGAQFRLGATPGQDALVIFAEAFKRDKDPEDFSLEALFEMLARGVDLARALRLANELRFVLEKIL